METVGYLSAVFMGVTLGLFGGGGSILAVPILVYCFGFSGVEATYSSLFVVSVCAAIALVPFVRRGKVEFKTGFFFFVPSVAGVALSRQVLLPAIPDRIEVFDALVTKDVFLLVAFSLVMLGAAMAMLEKSRHASKQRHSATAARVAVGGAVVGAVTGFVGAGGGFLIVPALERGLAVPMERAVGTSLLVIALNSAFGFGIDWFAGATIAWRTILPFLAISLAGIALGTYLNRRISPVRLKPAFGWFILLLGSGILALQATEILVSRR